MIYLVRPNLIDTWPIPPKEGPIKKDCIILDNITKNIKNSSSL